MIMRSQRRRGWQKGSEQGFDEDESADQSFFLCATHTDNWPPLRPNSGQLSVVSHLRRNCAAIAA